MNRFCKWFLVVCMGLLLGNNAIAQADTLMLTPEPLKTTSAKRVLAKRQQIKDSALKRTLDTVAAAVSSADSLSKPTADTSKKDTVLQVLKVAGVDTSLNALLYVVPIQNPRAKPIYQLEHWRQPSGKEGHFYLLVALALLLGITKTLFPQYFKHLFSFVAQTSYKQKHTQEQLYTSWLPSLFINLFFTATFAGVASAVITHYFFVRLDFFLMLLYVFSAIAITYLTKTLFLFFLGWATGWLDKAKTYVFIVLLINKLLAFLLLPILVFMLFAPASWVPVLVSISAAAVFIAFTYRYLVAFSSLRASAAINFFHFFLYFCSLEILPLLIIYKALYSGISN
ncbi:MAG: DUF4271 domain-containing protein [Bacteroidetes bacterium]|nr:MAG: DUF4271 domain-containing protein [Bacteroidota bacterium]